MLDAFIAHASEDKDAIARPLTEKLQEKGIKVWYDEYTLKLGDSLRQCIERGLSNSRYGIVILSKSFFMKDWPQKELDALMEREINNEKVILPIWHEITKEEVAKNSPLLVGKLAAKTEDGLDSVVNQIIDVIKGSNSDEFKPVLPISNHDNKITTLIRTLRDDYNDKKRINAAHEMRKYNEVRVIEALIEAVKYDKIVRYEALVSLYHLKNPKANDIYISHLKDPSSRIRHVSILGLEETGEESSIAPLQMIVETNDFWYKKQKRPGGKGQRNNWGKSENVLSAESAIGTIKKRLGNYQESNLNIHSKFKKEGPIEKVEIEANRDSIVWGDEFFITIKGRPNSLHFLWLKGTNSMSGRSTDQPPIIIENQEGVFLDPIMGPYQIGDYRFEKGAGRTIKQDVPSVPSNGIRYYALVELSNSGTRTVGFKTSADTKNTKYCICVESSTSTKDTDIGDVFISDTIDISVERGVVTIIADGDPYYPLGEIIKISGTNSSKGKVFLFITGPNLPKGGGNLTNPRIAVINDISESFTSIDVSEDNTWEIAWNTSGLLIDSGAYTIYAVSSPNNKDNLLNAQYSSVSVVIRNPPVSCSSSQAVIAQGDKLVLNGSAQSHPSAGVAIWIFGKNFVTYNIENVNRDSTFQYEISETITKNLPIGQYFVIIQHPMYNDRFDVYPKGDYVVGPYPVKNTENIIFALHGVGSLQESNAAEALITALNNPNVDDTYTKFGFIVEEPRITIYPITDKRVGEKFGIKGTTNLAVDDELLVEVIAPIQTIIRKRSPCAAGVLKVMKGMEGFNIWEFPLDTSMFEPGNYIINAYAVGKKAVGITTLKII